MRRLDHAHAGGTLLFRNLIAKGLHACPMDFRPEMMLGMVAIVEENPVVKLAVATYSPRNGLVGIRAVMPEVSVRVTETVTKVEKRKKE